MQTPRVLVGIVALGAGLTFATVIGSVGAGASDSTPCYTGCAAPQKANTPVVGAASQTATSPPKSTTATSGLAFTGADIAGMTIFAFILLGVGSTMVYVNRRSKQRSGTP